MTLDNACTSGRLGPSEHKLLSYRGGMTAWGNLAPAALRARALRRPVLTPSDLEPVSGFEPLARRLQELCSQAAHALAAPMAQSIALMAPTALGLFGASSHEPFDADGGQKFHGRNRA